jgi:hypothetical protein
MRNDDSKCPESLKWPDPRTHAQYIYMNFLVYRHGTSGTSMSNYYSIGTIYDNAILHRIVYIRWIKESGER